MEVNVSRDQVVAEEMVRISWRSGVPVTMIDGEPVVGYDPRRPDYLLESARRPCPGPPRLTRP